MKGLLVLASLAAALVAFVANRDSVPKQTSADEILVQNLWMVFQTKEHSKVVPFSLPCATQEGVPLDPQGDLCRVRERLAELGNVWQAMLSQEEFASRWEEVEREVLAEVQNNPSMSLGEGNEIVVSGLKSKGLYKEFLAQVPFATLSLPDGWDAEQSPNDSPFVIEDGCVQLGSEKDPGGVG